ncbi:MAG: hypothetical protein EAZ47_11530 [Bacteroidetes bacterium]|nr:MAG: hypothetical protein EAY72_04815 [Bacteroidota bacterium]TAF89757.1 MAG: hypothetical protein EAZ47_11530 [Bacteroidota bacterium]
MVIDAETNYLYLADTLLTKYPNFWQRFEAVLKVANIPYQFLQNTKDVWAVDYMPIQLADKAFVQFIYQPSYLQSKYYRSTISNVDEICSSLQIQPSKAAVKLEGGNIIRSRNSVIMTERVFKENSNISRHKLISQLQELLKVENMCFLPELPDDFTGHADGMLRFLDEKTLLVNDFSKESIEFQQAFKSAIKKGGFDSIEIPYNVYSNRSIYDANGTYINYLQMKNLLFIPVFNLPTDDIAVRQLEQLFPGCKIFPVNCFDIAKKGGVLNCISWNIKKWW